MRLPSIQLLRAFAALFVVFGHSEHAAQKFGTLNRLPFPTGSGVDLFFLISGFIMLYSTERLFDNPAGPGIFLKRRFFRIAPLYWGVNGVFLATLLIPSLHNHGVPSLWGVVSSYLFFPTMASGSTEGFPTPIMSLGWTLNYEMFFYLLFAPFIIFGRTRTAIGLPLLLAALVVGGVILEPGNTQLRFWTQPIILEFALGILIAAGFRANLKLPIWVRLSILAASIALLFANTTGILYLAHTPNDFSRVLGWGLPMAGILAATLLGPDMLPPALEKSAGVLGDASYSLYLTHPFVITIVEKLLPGLAAHHPWLVVLVILIGASATAIAVSRLIERPVVNWLQELAGSASRRPSPIPTVPVS